MAVTLLLAGAPTLDGAAAEDQETVADGLPIPAMWRSVREVASTSLRLVGVGPRQDKSSHKEQGHELHGQCRGAGISCQLR